MWKTKSLKDLCSIFTDGDWIEKKDQSVDGIRLVQTGNIKVGYFAERQDKARYISEDTFNRLNCTEVKRGDILVSRLPDPVGRASIIPELKDKAITAVDCTIIRLKEEILPTYLNYYMQSPQYLSSIQLKVTGATRQRISRKNLGEIPITLPPLAEQERIVAKLDAAFAEIDESVEVSLDQARNAKSLFESARASLFDTKTEDWAERTLGECCSRVSVGHVGPTSEYYCEADEGVIFLRSQNVKPAKLKLDGVRYITPDFHQKLKKSQLRSNDILIVRVGANRGDCCLVPDKVGELNCANIVFARPVEGYPPFLSHFCQSSLGRQRLMVMTTGAAQGVINTKSVAMLRVPFPPLEEQKAIAAKLDIINEQTIVIERLYLARANETKLLKEAILSQELQSSEAA